jgi:hypothetical protein
MKVSATNLPLEILEFDIKLSSSTILVPSNKDSTAQRNKMEGQVILNVKTRLTKITAVELRFASAVVTKSNSIDQVLYGREKISDFKMTLCDSQELSVGRHVFPFGIEIPAGCPPSIKSSKLIIQYLLLAMISFDNGCCGLVPFLAKDPVWTKIELNVVNSDIHSSVFDRAEAYNCKSMMGLRTLPEQSNPVLYWSPSPILYIEINPLQSLGSVWTFNCALDDNFKIILFEYSIRENMILKYQYGWFNHRNNDTSKTEIDKMVKEFSVIDSGSIELLDLFMVNQGDCNFFTISLPVANMNMLSDVHVINY